MSVVSSMFRHIERATSTHTTSFLFKNTISLPYNPKLYHPDITHPAKPIIHPLWGTKHFSTLSLNTHSHFKFLNKVSLCVCNSGKVLAGALGHVLDCWQPALIWLTGAQTNNTNSRHNITQRQVFPRHQLHHPWPAHTGLVFIPRALRGTEEEGMKSLSLSL